MADTATTALTTAGALAGDEVMYCVDGGNSRKTTAAEVVALVTPTSLSLVIGTNTQAWSANLDEYAAVNPTTAGLALLDDVDAAAQRTTMGAAASGANTDITALDQDITVTTTGTIAANTIGYRGLPASGQTPGSGITLALADAGKIVPNTTGGWTIPANGSIAFPVGTAVSMYNDSGSSQNIAITSDTMYLGGTATTGTRALAQRGLATIVKVASTTWVITGAGVS